MMKTLLINRFYWFRKYAYRVGIWVGGGLLGFQLYQSVVAFQSQQLILPFFWPIVIATSLTMLGILQQIEAWILIMRLIGVSIPSADARTGYILSFLSRYIPGSIWGYLSRGTWLKQKHQVQYSDTNLGSLLEVVFIIFGCLWAVGFCILATGDRLLPFWIGYMMLAIPLAFMLFQKTTFAERILNKGMHLLKNDRKILPLPIKHTILILSLYTLNWFYYGLALGLCGIAFGIWEVSDLASKLLFFTGNFGISWIVGFLVFFLPSGLGLRELLLSNLLTRNMQVGMADANALSVTMRFVFTSAEFIYIGFALVIRKLSVKKDPIKSEKPHI